MAAYFTVILHKSSGVIGGLFTNLSDATAFVGAKPNCGYEIQSVTLDAAVGQVIAQAGVGIPVSVGPGLNNLGA